MSQAESLSEAVLPFRAKQVQDVLAHPEIKALATRFPDHTKQLRSAIEGLSNEGPVETEILVQATKKAFDAITGKLRIFLSYKRVQHADVARLLRKSSQGLGGTKIDVFLDEMKSNRAKTGSTRSGRALRVPTASCSWSPTTPTSANGRSSRPPSLPAACCRESG